MRKIPKFNKTEHCFVRKISSEDEKNELFSICSEWAKKNNDKFFGFFCMDYGNTEPRLEGTIFYIYRSRNKKEINENNKSLIKFMESNGFSEVIESKREVNSILKILD